MTHPIPPNDDQLEEGPSRSEKKRQVEALQVLGERLLTLRPDQLARMPISDTLQHAVEEANRLKSRSALRRQRQYIGKLMRQEDSAQIAQALERFDATSDAHNQVFHKLEKWRDKLLSNDPHIMDTLVGHYPQLDIQYLRQLIRNAQREASQAKPPASARKLFKYLRELEESQHA